MVIVAIIIVGIVHTVKDNMTTKAEAAQKIENELGFDVNTILKRAVISGLTEGVEKQLSCPYNSNPLSKLIDSAINEQVPAFRELLESSIASCITDPTFRSNIATAVRHSLAKTLVQRFGGEIEKQVNVLKSDPTTRARITLAIEEIVRTTKT